MALFSEDTEPEGGEGLLAWVIRCPTADEGMNDAFNEYAMGVSVRLVRVAALVFAALTVLFWPTDWFLFDERPDLFLFVAVFRISFLSAAASGLLLLGLIATARRFPDFVFGVLGSVKLAIDGYAAAELAGPASVQLHACFVIPFVTVILLVGFKRRLLWTFLLPGAYVSAFYVSHPEYLARSEAATPIVFLGGTVLAAAALGHVVYLLTRANYIQSLLLARRTRELEAVDRIKTQFVREVGKDLRRQEEEIAKIQRMEAVGRLAGGVAHDFNNILTAIIGYIELAKQWSAPVLQPRSLKALERCLESAHRAESLVQQLLAYGRRQMLRPSVISVNDVIVESRGFLQGVLEDNCELQEHLAQDLWNVYADPSEIQRILVNLVMNANDSMPAGGSISIETSNVDADATSGLERLHKGQYVQIRVRDSGKGMDKETLSRVFEPFFTTKDVGKGTGLGLATVYGSVRQSGGDVAVWSEPGQGSAFTIWLPKALDAPVARAKDPGAGQAVADGRTVLIAEDEPGVAELARYALESSGYRVLRARDGAEALSVADSFDEPIHLLLTDVVMPTMGGYELAERLCEERRNTRVLFMSGYADEEADRAGKLADRFNLLNKPFTPAQLVAKVRESLAE